MHNNPGAGASHIHLQVEIIFFSVRESAPQVLKQIVSLSFLTWISIEDPEKQLRTGLKGILPTRSELFLFH